MRERMVTAVLAFACLVLGIVAGLTFIMEDKEGPMITYNSKDIVYHEGEGTDLLLKDVTAHDRKDGDVTDSLTIDDVVLYEAENKARVIYAAADKDSHVTKSSRTVAYEPKKAEESTPEPASEPQQADLEDDSEAEETIDPNAPVVKLSQKKVEIEKGASFSPLEYVAEATDDKDDVWKRLRISGQYDVNAEGTYEIHIYATDTDGNRSKDAVLTLVVK